MLHVWKVSTTRMMFGCRGNTRSTELVNTLISKPGGEASAQHTLRKNCPTGDPYMVELLHEHCLFPQVRHGQPYKTIQPVSPVV
jgi:hypothetical protein